MEPFVHVSPTKPLFKKNNWREYDIGQPIIQAIQETLMFLFISVDFMQGAMR
jgi:hypothetical protein